LKTIIVTGASRGIGNYLARRLSENGYHVIGVARSYPVIERFEMMVCDVSNGESVHKAFSALKKNTSVYGLINCAGILYTKPIISISNQEVSEIIDTNLKGTIFCCKNIIRPMIAHGSGRIINFSSIAATSALRGDSIYSASKAGVEVFSRAFAKELSSRSITVNCISPGLIETDMTSRLTEEQRAILIGMQIIQKKADTDDIWGSVKFLLSNDSRMISGQTLNICGV